MSYNLDYQDTLNAVLGVFRAKGFRLVQIRRGVMLLYQDEQIYFFVGDLLVRELRRRCQSYLEDIRVS